MSPNHNNLGDPIDYMDSRCIIPSDSRLASRGTANPWISTRKTFAVASAPLLGSWKALARLFGGLVSVMLILGQLCVVGVVAGPPIVPMEETGGSGISQPGRSNEVMALSLFEQVLTQRELNVCESLMTTSAIHHTPSGEFVGPAGFATFVAEVWKDYPNASFAIDEMLASGESLSLRWSMSGHHLGRPIALKGLAILRFEQGMIAESWIQYDRATLIEQVQAMPVPPELCPPCRQP